MLWDPKKFNDTAQYILANYGHLLKDNWHRFINQVYATRQEVYLDRLKAIGLDNQGTILDAGCGFGQWTLCMQTCCKTVHALDCDLLKTRIVKSILSRSLDSHFRVFTACMTSVPIRDQSYTAIFCYGAIFATDWKKTLIEFRRLLKPGGKLYLTANGIGYIVHLWVNEPNKTKDYNPRKVASAALKNSIDYSQGQVMDASFPLIIEKDELLVELNKADFEVIDIQPEGQINLFPGRVAPKPFFRAEYFNLPGCYEVLAERQ